MGLWTVVFIATAYQWNLAATTYFTSGTCRNSLLFRNKWSGIRFAQFLHVCVVFCESLLFSPFFFRSWYYLFLFDLRLLINTSVSSNCSLVFIATAYQWNLAAINLRAFYLEDCFANSCMFCVYPRYSKHLN
jgi:hypothetical protein